MLRSAAVLGAVSGMRTFGGWAGLALRGRVPDRRLRAGLLVAAAGELAADKSPWIPARHDPPALAGRVISGALAGRHVAGVRGACVGAATAAATTYASERARQLLGQRLGVPDPVLAIAEDVLVLGVATAASGADTTPADGAEDDPTAAAGPGGSSALTRAIRGLLAGAVGTAAMTSAQVAYLSATGGEPSSVPSDVGRKVIDVPRDRRAAFNQAMHVLYGTGWGAPFGLLARFPPRAGGARFGALVWGVSLVELPLLGVAPPPWRQSAASLATDLAFHLVYGTATAAAYEALDV